MFKLRIKSGSNKLTLIAIIMILAVIYLFRLISPQKEAAFPDIIKYDNLRYAYVETVKRAPVMFSRKRTASEDGYMILARRGISTLEEVYIYEGI